MNRAWGRRTGARVIVTTGDEVLLLADSDPGVPGSHWWVTPGGGIDVGEDALTAARRELHEETGLLVDAGALIGPVARRLVTHGYSDRVRIQDEWFFRVEVAPFDVAPAALTAGEQLRLQGHAWFPLHALPPDVWPAQLAQLAAMGVGDFVDLGEMEESTVPIRHDEGISRRRRSTPHHDSRDSQAGHSLSLEDGS